MGEIDRQYLETPFYGSRRMKAWLERRGKQVSRKRVQRLMRIMGLRAIYRKPKTSRPASERRVYPYLLRNTRLRNARITRANQVWAADITYLPIKATPTPVKPGGNWVPTCGSTTTRDRIRPWATGRRPRCFTRWLMLEKRERSRPRSLQ